MNKWKKLASLVLAMVMAFALAAPALAKEGTPEGSTEGNTAVTAGQYSITINNPSSSVSTVYNAYQIFTGDLVVETDAAGKETKILSNVVWGDNVNVKAIQSELNKEYGAEGATEDVTAADVAKWLSDHPSEENAKAFAKLVGGALADNGVASTQDSSDPHKFIINLTKPGYYLVKSEGAELGKGETYTDYILEVVGKVNAEHKGEAAQVTKKIKEENGNRVDVNNLPIGSPFEYEIVGTLPSNYDDYNKYYYKFEDTLGAGLDYTGNLKVHIATVTTTGEGDNKVETLTIGTDITEKFTVTPEDAVTADGHGETKITVEIKDLKTVTGVTKDSRIVVTYTAKLNKDANIGTTIAGEGEDADTVTVGNKNTVKLTYSNDPNSDTVTGTTPEDTVTTYTTELKITKVDGQNKNKTLTGAEFTLSGGGLKAVVINKDEFKEDAAGTYYKLTDGTYTTTEPTADTESKYESKTTKYTRTQTTEMKTIEDNATAKEVTGVVDADGILKFTGLSAGEYTLTEIKAPSGYNKLEKPITFEVTFKDGEFKVNVTSDNATIDATNGILSTTIENNSGTTLPSTGGIGTTIFYVVGGVLAAGAVILLITKRRMNIDKD